jgi:hypothetical protein
LNGEELSSLLKQCTSSLKDLIDTAGKINKFKLKVSTTPKNF